MSTAEMVVRQVEAVAAGRFGEADRLADALLARWESGDAVAARFFEGV